MRKVSKVNHKTLRVVIHTAPGIVSEKTTCGKAIGLLRNGWFALSYTNHSDAAVTCEKCKAKIANG